MFKEENSNVTKRACLQIRKLSLNRGCYMAGLECEPRSIGQQSQSPQTVLYTVYQGRLYPRCAICIISFLCAHSS